MGGPSQRCWQSRHISLLCNLVVWKQGSSEHLFTKLISPSMTENCTMYTLGFCLQFFKCRPDIQFAGGFGDCPLDAQLFQKQADSNADERQSSVAGCDAGSQSLDQSPSNLFYAPTHGHHDGAMPTGSLCRARISHFDGMMSSTHACTDCLQ